MTRWAHRYLPHALLRQRRWHALRSARGALLWTTGTTPGFKPDCTIYQPTQRGHSGVLLLRPLVYFYSGVDTYQEAREQEIVAPDDELLGLIALGKELE